MTLRLDRFVKTTSVERFQGSDQAFWSLLSLRFCTKYSKTLHNDALQNPDSGSEIWGVVSRKRVGSVEVNRGVVRSAIVIVDNAAQHLLSVNRADIV